MAVFYATLPALLSLLLALVANSCALKAWAWRVFGRYVDAEAVFETGADLFIHLSGGAPAVAAWLAHKDAHELLHNTWVVVGTTAWFVVCVAGSVIMRKASKEAARLSAIAE